MRLGEMLDDERREGREEGRGDGQLEGIALMEAMLADGKTAEISRLKEDSFFRAEMLERYHIKEISKDSR